MFPLFANQLCKELFKNEFQLINVKFKNEDPSSTQYNEDMMRQNITTLVKPVAPILYFILIVNCNNVDQYDFNSITKNYKAIINANMHQLNCTSAILLRIAVHNGYVSYLTDIEKEEFVPGLRFYMVTWFADLSNNDLFIPKGEVTDVLNIKNCVKYALSNYQTSDATENLTDIAKAAAIKNALPVKNTNSFLTTSIIILNAVIFIIMNIYPQAEVLNNYVSFGAVYAPNVWNDKEFYRLFSALFIHGDLAHLAFNCFGVMLFGTRLEKYLGRVSFIGVYFFSGIIANFVGLFVHPNAVAFGASGAVFALAGALTAYSHSVKRSVGGISFIAYLTILAGLLIPGFVIPNVDNVAHVVGMISGFVIAKIIIVITKDIDDDNEYYIEDDDYIN